MAAKPQPTARRIALGHQLRQLRKGAELTIEQAVTGMPFDMSTLQRVETGWRSFRQAGHLKRLLTRYGVDDEEEVERLVAMQRDASNREWWTGVGTTNMMSGVQRLVGVESVAREFRMFHPIIVPGILQTEKYAQAVHALSKPVDETTTEFVTKSVEIRMRRREAITRAGDPPKVWAILYEPALRYPVGDTEVMREQYAELMKLAGLENVTLQVLPQGATNFVAFHDVCILTLGEGLPPAVHTDTAWFSVAVSDKPRDVGRFSRMFDAMAAAAQPPGSTIEFLNELSKEVAA